MTHILGPLLGTTLPVRPDERIRAPADRWWHYDRHSVQVRPWEDGLLWPSSRLMGGDPTVPLWLNDALMDGARRYEAQGLGGDFNGNTSQLKISGITRDSFGNALGGCTVNAFRTSDGLLAGTCTSDGGGYFEVLTPYDTVGHYLECYKAGSPDVAGTSVNTLTAS